MTEHDLSPTDAALRERIIVLSVHIPCGGIRGPIQRATQRKFAIWQSCSCEDEPEKWDWVDISRLYDLCRICLRATAGGTSRFSWIACADCRDINSAVHNAWGFRPFALGRHSLMNGIGVQGGAPRRLQEQQLARLTEFARGDSRLREWRQAEYRRLAAHFDPLADVKLRIWQEVHPPSLEASRDAFARLIGPGFPLD